MEEKINTIFISHSSRDIEYVTQLVKIFNFLKQGLPGIKIFCSSLPDYDIPGDSNIFDYLKTELKGNVWVVYILSNNYYESAACLNEMGATWILNKKYSTFLTPNFEFEQIKGAIDPRQISYHLNNQDDLNKYRLSFEKEFSVDTDPTVWESARDVVIEEVDKIALEEKKRNSDIQIEVEDIRKKDAENITVYLRFINKKNYHIEIRYFEISLMDHNNESINEVIEESIKLYKNESKIHEIELKLGSSNFSAARYRNSRITKISSGNIF